MFFFCCILIDYTNYKQVLMLQTFHGERMLGVRGPLPPPPCPCLLSVGLEGLGQVFQHREQLLLLQGGAVGPGQRQVGGHHLAVCAQTQVRS